jgi:SAM-dependent methyltransferase
MDPKRDVWWYGLESAFPIKNLVQYLKHNFNGPDVVEALRYRTMIHWLNPELDPLSRQILGAYKKISELVELPFIMLDVGCMCGFFKHYLDQRTEYPFRYLGIDRWPESIQVAKEFSPHTDFAILDFLQDDPLFYIRGFDYVVVNNIQFGKDVPVVIQKAASLASRAAIFGMPKHCGDYYSAAKGLGFRDVEEFDCGETTVVKVNVNGTHDL